MKRAIQFLIAVLFSLCFCLSGCQLFQKSATFTVGYDYGFHRQGEATLLFSGSTPFFDPAEYGLTPLLAGEELTLSYTGELYVQESYPSQVVLKGKILSVRKTKQAKVEEILFSGVTGGKITANGRTFVNLPSFAITQDGSISEIESLTLGEALFVAYTEEEETEVQATAIYLYNPLG